MQRERRDNKEQLMIFGVHAVEELVKQNAGNIDKIYFTDKEKRGGLFELLKTVKKLKLNYANIPENKLSKMCDFRRHQGVVAFKTIRPYDEESKLWSLIEENRDQLFLLPSGLEDPGNFGAIIRSAAAFNVSAIILERKGTVALNGTVAKTSAGMVEQMTLIKSKNLLELIDQLKEKGFRFIGADGYSETPLEKADFSGPTVVITGGEHRGIPPYLRKVCDQLVSIPMKEGVESLNVSVAAGVMLYEAMRQR